MSNVKKLVLPFLLLCSLGTLAISMVFLWTSGIALDEMISVTEYFDSYGMLYWLLLLISILSSLSCFILLVTRNKPVQK
ncbi:hypothetical protein MKA31_12045 [[Clostridium] innocuum]|uniref:hypothetical protein n=1 Tax=Clostridium innocuum TaxID=1522 RepID=UPI00214852D7|nr:hypothetical protein [[Clostridium] innocuum]MCR0272814.1 hypothetical protein [[Clostridium] innocuum]